MPRLKLRPGHEPLSHYGVQLVEAVANALSETHADQYHAPAAAPPNTPHAICPAGIRHVITAPPAFSAAILLRPLLSLLYPATLRSRSPHEILSRGSFS